MDTYEFQSYNRFLVVVICNITGVQEVRGISLYQALRGWKLGTVVQTTVLIA